MSGDRAEAEGSGRGRAVDNASRVLLALTALASGGALLATVLLHAPLGLTLGAFAVLAVAGAAFRLSRLEAGSRLLVRHRAAAGVVAGTAATIAYDLTRVIVVAVTGFQVNPMATWPIFGQLIIGGNQGLAQWVVGIAYHYTNGVMFAVAYCILLPGRRWLFGVAWAIVLEGFTLSVYPGWLNLHDIVLQEFTVVSMSGHLAYGAVLGLIGQRLLAPGQRPASQVP